MVARKEQTILIVEDDPGVAKLEQRQLVRAGYHVLTAANAKAGLQLLHEHKVDLILLDYRLPGNVDGLAFYAQVKRAGYDLPVILVTGHSSEATVIQALRVGVRDFVTKSVEYLDYLPEAVERVLKQVQTEHQLAESEARLASIINSTKDAILVVDAAQQIILFNTAAEQMFCSPAALALGQPISRFIPRPSVDPPSSTSGVGEQESTSLTSHIRKGTQGVRADGEVFPLEASIARVNMGGSKCHTIVVRDITERQRADQRIRELATLLEKAQDAILIRDQDDTIVFWNQGAERLYGWTALEAVGKKSQALLFRQRSSQYHEVLRAVVEHGEWLGELEQVARSGKPVVVTSHWTLARGDQGKLKGNLIINTDITEKKRLETQLLHAQRMESIGRLAGGVAHDFNNLLTVISGYSELLLMHRGPDDPMVEPLREIRKAGERAASLTRQLLAFSRKQILQLQLVNLNQLVRESEKMLRRLIGEDIDFATALAPGLGSVKTDPGQMEQVLLNLIVNARDAMPTGGHLTVETHNVDLDESYAQQQPGLSPGPYVMLAITDTGTGMDESVKSRIFEPFFTTKEAGRGTGLGLATVFGIVKQSAGHIEVYSEVGYGTTFKIYLPRQDQDAQVDPEFASALKAPTGTETVLLAEDEDGVRALARLALQSHGLVVLEARNGQEAIDTCRRYHKPIHLLVTDVVMPNIGGRQLADRVLALRPGIKVLYLSGYTDDAVVRHGVLQAGTPFLQKPFTPMTLARKVREILDG
jgi:two-component system cell cycle sensor histidine kinase/response regulator CckA